MCMEDIRIGRTSVTTTTLYNVLANTVTTVAQQRPDRIAIRVQTVTSNDTVITTWTGAVAPDFGGVGAGVTREMKLDIQHDGDAATQPVVVWNFGTGFKVVVSETFFGEDEWQARSRNRV